MWCHWEHLWEFNENMTIIHWEFDVNTLRTWREHFEDIKNPNLPHLPNPFLSTLIPPPWWVWVPIYWFCWLKFLVDFCFVLVMDIFDWPIIKTNTQTMDSLKIEDYVALPICLDIKFTRVEFWPKDMGYNVVLLGTAQENMWTWGTHWEHHWEPMETDWEHVWNMFGASTFSTMGRRVFKVGSLHLLNRRKLPVHPQSRPK
jgi:hypothetical protein